MEVNSIEIYSNEKKNIIIGKKILDITDEIN